MHSDRLLKLAAFLRTLPRKNFHFGTVRVEHSCGTLGCAIGWTPEVFPDLVAKGEYAGIRLLNGPSPRNYWGIGEVIFGISRAESIALFTPQVRLPWLGQAHLGDGAAPSMVAESIEAFVKWKEAGNAL